MTPWATRVNRLVEWVLDEIMTGFMPHEEFQQCIRDLKWEGINKNSSIASLKIAVVQETERRLLIEQSNNELLLPW